jgi:hypothetical protein
MPIVGVATARVEWSGGMRALQLLRNHFGNVIGDLQD